MPRVRRAGLLLSLLVLALGLAGCSATTDGSMPTASRSGCADAIPWRQARSHIGEVATVRGPVVSTYYATESGGQPTFLNIGRPHPNRNRVTALIWGDDRGRFPTAPEIAYRDRTVCVSGTIELYEGAPEIIVESPGQIEPDEHAPIDG